MEQESIRPLTAMKNITPPTAGKILVHNHGTGLFSRDGVTARRRRDT
jgi:hypothetical protein